MSYQTDLFSSSPTESIGNDAGTDPAATALGTASHAGDHCPAPPHATISPSSLDDLWHWAFQSYGLKRPTEVTEIHVFRVILQSSRDKNACTRSITKAGPMSDPVQTLEKIIEEWWDLEIEEHDQSWDAFLCAQCLHVVSEQRLVLPCLCADPQGKSIPSPTPPWCF